MSVWLVESHIRTRDGTRIIAPPPDSLEERGPEPDTVGAVVDPLAWTNSPAGYRQ
jgi:hypothetical protein